MDNLTIGRDDIQALARAVDDGAVPASDLLRALVTALQSAVGEDDVVSLSVETVGELFDAAFVAEPPSEAAAPQRIRVTVAKIGR